jgi:hypothetical protein
MHDRLKKLLSYARNDETILERAIELAMSESSTDSVSESQIKKQIDKLLWRR